MPSMFHDGSRSLQDRFDTILYAEVDAAHARAERVKFDPVGHYARPDVFQLTVDERAKTSVAER